MATITFNQEILLIGSSSLSKQELCNRTSTHDEWVNNASLEKLVDACWAGLICELLPELIPGLVPGCKIFVWNVIASNQCLVVNQGTAPFLVNKIKSLDPHSFLPALQYN